MSAYGLISSLAWAAVVLIVAWRAERVLMARLGGEATPVDEPVVLPPDVAGFVANFASEWARADAKKAIVERYEQARDWNVVRRAFGLGVTN
jgi:hypothetical protein